MGTSKGTKPERNQKVNRMNTYIVNYSREETFDWGFEEFDSEEVAKDVAKSYQDNGYEVLVEVKEK